MCCPWSLPHVGWQMSLLLTKQFFMAGAHKAVCQTDQPPFFVPKRWPVLGENWLVSSLGIHSHLTNCMSLLLSLFSLPLFPIFWNIKTKQKLLVAFLVMVNWFGMYSVHKFARDLPVIITDGQREPLIVSIQINCHSKMRYERLPLVSQILLTTPCHFRLYW